MSDRSLVYTIDLIFAILIGILILARLPRAFALFGSSKEWRNGHFIQRITTREGFTTSKESYKSDGLSSDDSHISCTGPQQSQRLDNKGLPMANNLPLHIAACPRLLRPFLALLRMRISPGFSLGQFVITAIYFVCVIYAIFFRSNIFTDKRRTGWLATSQLPIVFVFALKNNLIGSILGYSYEKLNFVHRFSGRLAVLAANIHSLHWLYKRSIDGTLSQKIQIPSCYWGVVALICMDLLCFFSTEFWRKRAYNVFLTTHIVGFSLLLPAIYMHTPSPLIFIVVCVVAYGMDHVVRMLKTRVATAHLHALPELDMTRVEIPTLNAGWRAGQHVRLRVLSTAMGWASWLEVHPFTIASVSKSEEGMVLMVKKTGGWTGKMFEVAKASEYMGDGNLGRDMKVLIEGPYGGPQHTIMSSFSAAVFIVGGSGITFALSAIQDIIQKDLAGESRVKVVELVWIISDPASLSPLLPHLSSLIQKSINTPLRISVFYTRVRAGKQPAFIDATRSAATPLGPPPLNLGEAPTPRSDSPPRVDNVGGLNTSVRRKATLNASEKLHVAVETQNYSTPDRMQESEKRLPAAPAPAVVAVALLPPGLTLSPGRPKVVSVIEHALDSALELGKSAHQYTRAGDAPPRMTGLLVGVCGPLAMADAIAGAVGVIDAVRRDQVGGIELVEEAFGW
ncbi:hypothetical protein HYPSUDRAFT_205502 [Hypholoma sublateritium FD-334 SS-4]|uniref:ferric-chelate reductase (NADPH) n=1 Tax=Hypholoma sublateritium (strain FD-334 SS-4) TaxID=945553 RepID=A0A0D2M523_HYPSF|nr:hypothetical protein HYPSUDRAFT_205502 [Hypholoma sublateritium FD-334 SS-4]